MKEDRHEWRKTVLDLHLESFSGWGADVIVCYDCLATFSQQEITCEEDLIRAWNRRAKDEYQKSVH